VVASNIGRFTPWKRNASTHRVGGWVVPPRGGLDASRRGKALTPTENRIKIRRLSDS